MNNWTNSLVVALYILMRMININIQDHLDSVKDLCELSFFPLYIINATVTDTSIFSGVWKELVYCHSEIK